MMRWVAVAAATIGVVGSAISGPRESAAQVPKGKTRQVVIVDPSDWNGVITRPGGAQQKISIRLRRGVILPAIHDNPAGTFEVDAEKRLHIAFEGHPVVPTGRAVLEKQVAGRWAGVLEDPQGQSRIEIRRVEERRKPTVGGAP